MGSQQSTSKPPCRPTPPAPESNEAHTTISTSVKEEVAENALISLVNMDLNQLDGIELPDNGADTTFESLSDDLLILILQRLSKVDGWGVGYGGMTCMRAVSKRMMQMVESCTKQISHGNLYGVHGLPLALKRCSRVTHIHLSSTNLKSLEGVPPTLQSLFLVGMQYSQMYLLEGGPVESLRPLGGCPDLEIIQLNDGCDLTDLSPLASCHKMKSITIHFSKITNISSVTSMPLLENFALPKGSYGEGRYIDDLAPLLQCKKLKRAHLMGNELKDDSAVEELRKNQNLMLLIKHGDHGW